MRLTMEDLAARLLKLESKEAVRDAMCRYWRSLDYKQWDELEDCFTEDADADWGTAGWNAIGRKDIYAFLHDNESRSDLRLSHFGHNPEVEILGEGEARAIFKLEDWVTIGGMTVMRGFGQYNMLFEQGGDGVWRIKRLRLLHDFREESRVYVDGQPIELTPALGR